MRQIPDEVLNNAELQDAVRQVKNVRICLSKKNFKPSGNVYGFFVTFIFIQCNLKQKETNNVTVLGTTGRGVGSGGS